MLVGMALFRPLTVYRHLNITPFENFCSSGTFRLGKKASKVPLASTWCQNPDFLAQTIRVQLIDRCLILFQSLLGSLLNRFHHYANKNASVKPLSLNCIASFFSTIYSLKNCSVYRGYCVNCSYKQFEFSFCYNFL